MRLYIPLFLAITLLLSCKKEQGQPPVTEKLPKMKVKEFNLEISKKYKSLSLDMDDNGFGDVSYIAYHIQDMNLPGYKLKFYGGGSKYVSFPLNTNNQTQETLMLRKGDRIDKDSFSPPFDWQSYPFVLMATKNEPYFDQPTSWEGAWKDLRHVYQAFVIHHPTGFYYGWVELSFDTAAEKLIIHSAAMSMEPDKGVRAGYR